MLDCFRYSFVATDDTNASSSLTVPLKLCDCNGDDHGQCDFDIILGDNTTRSENNTGYFNIVQCICITYLYEGKVEYIV